jgi:hypothetical protein
MLAGIHAGRDPCWQGSMLAGIHAGRVHAGRDPCWQGSMLAGIHAGRDPCWQGSMLAEIHGPAAPLPCTHAPARPTAAAWRAPARRARLRRRRRRQGWRIRLRLAWCAPACRRATQRSGAHPRVDVSTVCVRPCRHRPFSLVPPFSPGRRPHLFSPACHLPPPPLDRAWASSIAPRSHWPRERHAPPFATCRGFCFAKGFFRVGGIPPHAPAGDTRNKGAHAPSQPPCASARVVLPAA